MKMPVRGSPNYVWFTEQVLGSGASGTVYLGRHKRQGDLCAVKVFIDIIGNAHVKVKQRELALMSRLTHANVIRFLAIEQESHTKQEVLMMEYCTEGSVHDMLEIPKYGLGLDTDMFIKFFIDVMAGIEYLHLHGIIHRDIKPGNILCTKLENGTYLFKVTDFGSAKEYNEYTTDYSGTEEYLHPDTYGRALMCKQTNRTGDDVSLDIWSLGATLYHVITGMVPFRPYGGRNNRQAMYDMLLEKQPGMISCEQPKENADFIYSDDLPTVCNLARGVQLQMLPLIAGCMERDNTLQWNFEKIFNMVSSFNNLVIIHVYSVVTITLHYIIIPMISKIADLQDAIADQTGIPVNKQIILTDTNIDVVKETTADEIITRRFSTVVSRPLLLIPIPSDIKEYTKIPTIVLPVVVIERETKVDINRQNIHDVKWAFGIAMRLFTMQKVVSNMIAGQEYLNKIKQLLSKQLRDRFNMQKIRTKDAHTALKSVGETIAIVGNPVIKVKESGASVPEVKQASEFLLRINKLYDYIHSIITEFPIESLLYVELFNIECIHKRCLQTLSGRVETSFETHNSFVKDSKAPQTYNDSQVHKYKAIKLETSVNHANNEIIHHCDKHSRVLINMGIDWIYVKYSMMHSQLDSIDINLDKLIKATTNLGRFVTTQYKSRTIPQSITSKRNKKKKPSAATATADAALVTDLPTTSGIERKVLRITMAVVIDNIRINKEIVAILEQNQQYINELVKPRS
jgi:serine/threonine protein kinase